MNIIVILTNMIPILLYYGINLRSILLSIYYITLWFFTEDFLWFVFNPYYTIKKYTKESIPWHSNQPWIFGMPLHNYICFTILGFITYILKDYRLLKIKFLLFIYTLILINISKYYHKFYMKQNRHLIE